MKARILCMAAAGVVTTVLLNGMAIAGTEAPQCASDHGSGPAYNEGQGLVAQGWSTESPPFSGARGMSIEHCASGAGLNVTAQVWGEYGTTPEEVLNPLDVLRAAMASPEQITFDDLAARYQAEGMWVERTSSTGESCGCAAFYPELRGTKTPWRSQ